MQGFYQSSLGNEVDLMDTMNVSPDILAKNQNFKKLRHDFVDEKLPVTGKPLYIFVCERKGLKTHF